MPLAGGIGLGGDPLELVTAGEDGVAHSGAGKVLDNDEGSSLIWLGLVVLEESVPQSGVLALTYPEPVDAAETRGYIAFESPWDKDWIVDHASFLVTETCTIEVEILVVDPPVVEQTAVELPIAEQEYLAETGANVAATVTATAPLAVPSS